MIALSRCGEITPHFITVTSALPEPQGAYACPMWEIDEASWDHVSEKVRRELETTARAGKTITYTDLVTAVDGPEGQRFEGPQSHRLAHLWEEGRQAMISVHVFSVAVGRVFHTKTQPLMSEEPTLGLHE